MATTRKKTAAKKTAKKAPQSRVKRGRAKKFAPSPPVPLEPEEKRARDQAQLEAEDVERDDHWQPWYDDFLDALREECSVVHAASVVGKSSKTCYRHRKKHAGFAAAWHQAWESVVDELEASAMKRAIRGTAVPVLYRDKVITAKRDYETALTIFMLKKNRPKYADDLVADEKDAREKARELREALRAIDDTVPEAEE